MDDDIGFDVSDKPENCVAIPNINVEMAIIGNRTAEELERPSGVSVRPEEDRALVVIYAENLKAFLGQMCAYFGPNETTGTCDES
jgi:hypothetical protein